MNQNSQFRFQGCKDSQEESSTTTTTTLAPTKKTVGDIKAAAAAELGDAASTKKSNPAKTNAGDIKATSQAAAAAKSGDAASTKKNDPTNTNTNAGDITESGGTLLTTTNDGDWSAPTIGTMFTDGAISGLKAACELPNMQFNHDLNPSGLPYVFALGYEDGLGDDLKQSTTPTGPRNCGQVYEIRCQKTPNGHRPDLPVPAGELLDPIYAVVVDTCNFGNKPKPCGVDMQLPTWNAATGRSPSGDTNCEVQRSTTMKTLAGDDYQCFHRYVEADKVNDWYASLGLFNTQG